ncbi:MAG: GspH/FimT family pseudopilin [Desulfosalsimonadaceae bacterium]
MRVFPKSGPTEEAGRRNRVRSGEGFTLLELMTAVAVISIMTAIAMPDFLAWQRSARLRSAVRGLITDLSMARSRAVNTGNDVISSFSRRGYQITVDKNGNNKADAADERLRNKTYPTGVSMSATTFYKEKALFHPSGSVNGGTIYLGRDAAPEMKVVVNFAGRIRTALN